jgi:hypothetical protein
VATYETIYRIVCTQMQIGGRKGSALVGSTPVCTWEIFSIILSRAFRKEEKLFPFIS